MERDHDPCQKILGHNATHSCVRQNNPQIPSAAKLKSLIDVDAYAAEPPLEQISLLDRLGEQVLAGGDDRRQTTRAREAAEALFAPKRPMPKALAIKSPSPAEASGRKPRVLSISPSPVPAGTAEPSIRPAPPVTPAIPKSEVARIRTWLKYGMTIAQAAAVYGVAVDEVERVLRRV